MENSNLLKIWLIPSNASLKRVTLEEQIFSEKLTNFRKKEFMHSRGYLREVLSKLLSIDPLEVPITAPLGQPPILKDDLGYISFSHCQSALAICWSSYQIGVDIELESRNFKAKELMERVFFNNEIEYILKNKNDEMRSSVLRYWVLKEACIKLLKGSISKTLNRIKILDVMVAKNLEDGNLIKLMSLSYRGFIIGIASSNINIHDFPIICDYY